MFTTFAATSPPSSAANHPERKPKPKRFQVHRACNWCRLNRVKCDNNRPCLNCEHSERRCSNDGGPKDFGSVVAATKEVERLRSQIKVLERQVRDAPASTTAPRNATSPAVSDSRPSDEDTLESHDKKTTTRQWEGIHVVTHKYDDQTQVQTQLYGPSSLPYFLHRLSATLSASLQLPALDISPHRPNPSAMSLPNSAGMASLSPDQLLGSDYLPRPQQDYFLDLFWQGPHCIYPIIDEAEFRQHYESLWADSYALGGSRKPSPLVEIVLALCIQFGTTFMPQKKDQVSSTGEDDASTAGFVYYQRCHSLLSSSGDAPSVTMLQSYVFSIVYLLNASLANAAQTVTANAIRMAYIIGLNQEPPDHLPSLQKELRRRIWWTLYQFDSQSSMELGRPALVQLSSISCRLPNDSIEAAKYFGANYFSPLPDVTFLSFQNHALRLVDVVRVTYTAFYGKCNEVINNIHASDFYSDSQAREQCAQFLAQSMNRLKLWVQQLPEGFKTPRKSNSEAFSTDRSLLELDPSLHVWLQRQRLLLELQYHNLAMNLYRPFICFSPTPSQFTPHSDGNAISCLNHAITITNIMHQVLTETDVLNGWYRAFQWQQNAMYSMIGFAAAYPVCPPTPSARKAILTAISVFELYGNNFAAAQHAARLTRELSTHADSVLNLFRAGLMGSRSSSIVGSIVDGTPKTTPDMPSPAMLLMNGTSAVDVEAITAGGDAGALDWASSDSMSTANNHDIQSNFMLNFDFSMVDTADPTEPTMQAFYD